MAEEKLEVQVGEKLREKGWTISAAESCTGGLVMHRLTNVSGSSSYVLGGLVAYSNEIKQAVLNVQESLLIDYGAVSEQVAAAMAANARGLFGTDVGIGVTGIAGPGGGTAEKPVGLTYIGCAVHEGLPVVRRFVWDGDRETNKVKSADAALQLVLEMLG